MDHGEDEGMKHLEDEIGGYREDVESAEYVKEDPKDAFDNDINVNIFSF